MHLGEQLGQLCPGCLKVRLLVLIRGETDDNLMLLLSHNECKGNHKSKKAKKLKGKKSKKGKN